MLDGAVRVDGAVLGPAHLGYLGQGRDDLRIEIDGPARVLLIGGEPFESPILMSWNFVARTRDEIDAAHASWNEDDGRFGRVDSRLARIPAPPPAWAPSTDEGRVMSTEVIHDEAAHRFEIHVDGERAGLVDYRDDGGAIRFVHTETDDRFQVRASPRRLVESALGTAREQGRAVLPECPYVRKVIAESTDRWIDLVPVDRRSAFGLPG